MSAASRIAVRRAFGDALKRAGWPAIRIAAFDRALAALDELQDVHGSTPPAPGTSDAWRLTRTRCRLLALTELFDWHRAGARR